MLAETACKAHFINQFEKCLHFPPYFLRKTPYFAWRELRPLVWIEKALVLNMKKDMHPDYHEIVVTMTDGTEFKTRSTYGKPGERIQLDIDPKTHPAWTGKQRLLDRGSQLAKFNKRFAGLSGKTEEKAEAPSEKIKLTTTAKKKKA